MRTDKTLMKWKLVLKFFGCWFNSFSPLFLCSSHLNGCTLESISRPSLLITDSFNATYVQPRRKQRDEMLLSK